MDFYTAVRQTLQDFPLFVPGGHLKEVQQDVMIRLISGESVFSILPTGFGKSICFQMPVLILDKMQPNHRHIALVVSPLVALISEQVEKLKGMGVKAIAIKQAADMTAKECRDIARGNCSIVYSSPEAITSPKWLNVLHSDVWKQRLALVAIDECHCVTEWGNDFRPQYKAITELRAHCNVPFLLTSATVNKTMHKELTNMFGYTSATLSTISMLPNRPEIKLNFKSESGMSYQRELGWVVNMIREKGDEADKIIIYCRSHHDVENIWFFLHDELRLQAYHNKVKTFNNRLVLMFHSDSKAPLRQHLLEEFPKVKSTIRVLVCTVAFGMGLDVPDVRHVVHWGAPSSILEYWQEVGRCSRDGQPGQAHLYATKHSLIKKDNMTELCKDISKTPRCL